MRKRATPSRRWNAWAGELDELRRIGRVLEDAASGHPDAGQITVTATLYEAEGELEGSVDDILSVLDRRSARRLDFELREKMIISAEHRVTIRFEGGELGGIALDVQSSAPDWARSTFVALSNEIERGVPRWAVLHNAVAMIFAVLAISAVSISSMFLALRNTGISRESQAALGVLLAAPFVVPRFQNWLLPRFEVVGQNGPSGTRRIVTLGLVVAQIPVGLLVNFMKA